MYVDAFLLVSDSQAVTVTAVSTHTIDLSNVTPKRDIEIGEALGFAVCIEVAADFTTGDETYTLEVLQSANADLSAPDVIASRLLSAAERAAGSLIFVGLGAVTKRYVGMRYTTAGTTPTVTLSSWLTSRELFSKQAPYYARNYAV
jgi:hypothetical protein